VKQQNTQHKKNEKLLLKLLMYTKLHLMKLQCSLGSFYTIRFGNRSGLSVQHRATMWLGLSIVSIKSWIYMSMCSPCWLLVHF